ncbi:MAG: clan AA aspartic protease [Treponema sp.]|jgi:clan AA aspartic protease|nr:clan AA aspartic protease [Treponema sp.]
MGTVYADITLKNAGDEISFRRGYISEKEIRAVTVRAIVDTGAATLVINEELMRQLGLETHGLRRAALANNAKEVCKVTDPVEIQWKNRDTTCRALALPDSPDVLLGAIPLEDMDLIVNPAKQELEGAHGDEIVTMIL